MKSNQFKTKLVLKLILLMLIGIKAYAQNDMAMLRNRAAAIAANSGCVVGVSAVLVETNQSFSYNGNTPFLMASTVKLPIAITFLRQVDAKKVSLNDMVTLSLKDSVPGSGNLYYILDGRPLSISYLQLLRRMLVVSDNTASDTILRKVGGPTAVTQKMQSLGLNHILVARSIRQDFIEQEGADNSLMHKPCTRQEWKNIFENIPVQIRAMAWRRFESNTADTTTPNDMAQLLAKLQKGDLLSQANTTLLLNIMKQCRTGKMSIRGLLPPKTPVAHKTGSWFIYSGKYLQSPQSKLLYRYVSDVGIITLPNKQHLAIAVYVKSKGVSNLPRFKAIAQESKLLYDYFSTHS